MCRRSVSGSRPRNQRFAAAQTRRKPARLREGRPGRRAARRHGHRDERDARSSRLGLTDETGYYRLINLPPGNYTVTAELTGFATFKREGILMRAGATFQVDITMELARSPRRSPSGRLADDRGDKPSNVLNIDGEFQRQMPLQARRNWSDFLELTPGVHSRAFDDGSGRRSTSATAPSTSPTSSSSTARSPPTTTTPSSPTCRWAPTWSQDTQVKTGGVDAATPMGTGLAMNVITKSGGNTFKGSGRATPISPRLEQQQRRQLFAERLAASRRRRPRRHADHRHHPAVRRRLRRPDQDGQGLVLRRAPPGRSSSGISRTAEEVERIKSYYPGRRAVRQQHGKLAAVLQDHLRLGSHETCGVLPARPPDARPATGSTTTSRSNVYSTGGRSTAAS